jgi:hypothetical protein
MRIFGLSRYRSIPAALWSKTYVCSGAIAAIAGSNPAEGVDVCCAA